MTPAAPGWFLSCHYAEIDEMKVHLVVPHLIEPDQRLLPPAATVLRTLEMTDSRIADIAFLASLTEREPTLPAATPLACR